VCPGCELVFVFIIDAEQCIGQRDLCDKMHQTPIPVPS
jgi:hypothetical protein